MKKFFLLVALAALPMLSFAVKKQKQQVLPEPVVVDTLDSSDEDELSFDELDALPDGVPSGLQVRMVDDTLFLDVDQELLPRRIIVVSQNGEALYKLLPKMIDDSLSGEHPAADTYKHIWTNMRVNPYQTPIDSISDSISIDMTGFRLPHPGYVTSHFGFRKYRFHYGTDLKLQVGDSVRAVWDGQVRIVGWDPRGYGHYVVVRHNNGLETVYAHLSQPLYYENEFISAGEVLGLGGNTGRSTGPHLHFEIRYLGNAINPELVVDFATGKLINTTQVSPDAPVTYLLTKKGTFRHKEEVQQIQSAQYHTIRQGDTLSGIAKRYHTKVSTLCKLNHIKETTILQLGKKLRVR